MREAKTKQLRKFCDYKLIRENNPIDFLTLRPGYRKMKRIFQTLTPAQKKRSDAFMVCALKAGLLDGEKSEGKEDKEQG